MARRVALRYDARRESVMVSWWAGVGLALVASGVGAAPPPLRNEALQVEFGERGVTSVTGLGQTIRLASDECSLLVNSDTFDSEYLTPAVDSPDATTRIYRYDLGPWSLRATYELKPGWRFVSKRVTLTTREDKPFRVGRVEPLRAALADPVTEAPARLREAVFLRPRPEQSVFCLLQNPFLQWRWRDGRLSLSYFADMAWSQSLGMFSSDRVCFGPVACSGARRSVDVDWAVRCRPAGAPPPGPTFDQAELEAAAECARAFLTYRPTQAARVHIGWCENDYQIDLATAAGREEYKRILDQAAAVGCKQVLFTPANGDLAPLKDNRDAWGWENVLWLNLGQKVRRGEWDPAKDDLPPVVREMLDYAKAKGLGLMAYIYPSLPFLQDPQWTRWIKKGQPGGYLGADTGERGFQDWLIEKMVAFQRKTGIAGFCFDHWWVAYDDATSKYAQWYGCRRILEELRRRLPDTVLDGRQQYHWFGTWTWLAGSYPHPLTSDEQPQSFRAFSDLHWSRASADRQRLSAWYYRMGCYAPVEVIPGYMTHQTNRIDLKNVCRKDTFRPRDWDLLGWRYSVISALGTGPFNSVINMLPARDSAEFAALSAADKAWFRGWLDWADGHLGLLRHLRPVLGPPAIGQVDATAAVDGERGVIFLFNPNYRPLRVDLPLDRSIGLTQGANLVLRQLYPDAEQGRLLPHPARGLWQAGDTLSLELPGAEALVLEVGPAPQAPLLLGAVGQVALRDGRLELTNVSGEVGAQRTLQVVLPAGDAPRATTLNGRETPTTREGDRLLVKATFAGAPFARCQQVGGWDPTFTGGAWRATATIPARIGGQLAARRRAWPVAYTEDDLVATYLGADRVLLFVNIADPNPKMQPKLKIDSQERDLKAAYTSIYPHNPNHTFVGWYTDVTALAPDTPHTFELELPTLAAGQFQGLFLDGVETEVTGELRF